VRRVVTCLLLLALAAAAEPQVARFRLKRAPAEYWNGWILEYDHATLLFQRFGEGRKLTLEWSDVVDEDALALRRRFGLELPETEEPGHVAAHRVHFRSGIRIEGLLVRVDEQRRHWIKRDGVVVPFPGDQVVRVEEIRLYETDVYDPEELYVLRLLDRPPRTADEHVDLASYLYDIGNFERAREHYKMAIEMRGLLRPALEPRLERIRAYLAEAEAAAVFKKAKRRGLLHGDHEGAVALVEEFVARRPDVKREGFRIIEEIEERRRTRMERRFPRYKHRAIDRAIRDYLVKRRPGCEEAMAWVRASLAEATEARVRRRLRLDEDEYRRLLAVPKRGAPHWATYWSGTFVVGKRTRGRKADPEAWWAAYDDVTKRTTFLKAYAAERIPDLFEVDRVVLRDCERCGGTGQVRKMAFRAPAGRNEWRETCPRCHGARQDRGVGYR